MLALTGFEIKVDCVVSIPFKTNSPDESIVESLNEAIAKWKHSQKTCGDQHISYDIKHLRYFLN